MPSLLAPTTVFSPWSRRYAIAADARLMTSPNTARPRETSPTPSPPPVEAPSMPSPAEG